MGRMKKLAAAGLLLLGARALLAGGTGEALAARRGEAVGFDMVTASLRLELGPGPPRPLWRRPRPPPPPLRPRLRPQRPPPGPPPALRPADDAGADIVETTIYGGLSIKNSTSLDIDVGELVRLGPTQVLPRDGPQILIVHTHGSEAYTPDRFNQYEESDSFRTEDRDYNVIRVGDELASALESQGLSVLHDREIYDYPSYTGSYNRSGAAVEAYLEQYPGIAVVIDLHRDALGDGDVVYKTMAELGRPDLVPAHDARRHGRGGLSHPEWEQNLRLAL